MPRSSSSSGHASCARRRPRPCGSSSTWSSHCPLIGVTFLTTCLLLAQVVAQRASAGALRDIVREGLTIGGWVAMWRPMEIYLYDWWPIWRRGLLLRRLGRMDVEVRAPVARAAAT
jgi:hypothetical protein